MKAFVKRVSIWTRRLEELCAEAETRAAARGAVLAREYAPVDSGELRDGIIARRDGDGAAVVSTAPHGAMLEFGTSRSAAQPYLRPMAQDMRAEFVAMAEAAGKEALR